MLKIMAEDDFMSQKEDSRFSQASKSSLLTKNKSLNLRGSRSGTGSSSFESA